MNARIALTLSALAALSAAAPNMAEAAPRARAAVSIHQHADYEGASQTLRLGSYNMDELSIGNDQLSSVKVPRGLSVVLYEHADFQGDTRTLTADDTFLSDFNDVVSSIVVSKASASKGRSASIFQHADYEGSAQSLAAGSYNMDELSIGNDQLSSVKVPRGMTVVLYEHADFQGDTRTLTADDTFLSDFNDVVSSIVVR